MSLPPNDSHLKPGVLVAGKYRLRRPIGEGAMGVVWAAFNETTSRELALKLVVEQDRDLRARLLQEARACGRLKHRNIVQVYDVDQTERGEPFLVMPLLSGETLAALLKRRRRLDAGEAARIGRDIARGLAAAHAMQIVHRDLKPSNVFLHIEPDEKEYTVKLLDFGISKVASTGRAIKTATGIILGSPAYMSPEQVRSLPDIDGRADIWCLGVVLFEMLAGVRPFQGSLEGILRQILAGEIPSVSQAVRNLDPRLAQIVSACLQRDRDQRPGSAAEVAGWLDAFASSGAGHPAIAAQPSPGPYGVQPPARSPWDSELREQTTLPLQRGEQRALAAAPQTGRGAPERNPEQRGHAPRQPGTAAATMPLPGAVTPGAQLAGMEGPAGLASAPQLPHPAGGPAGHSLNAPQPSAVDLVPQPRSQRPWSVALAAVLFSMALLLGAAVMVLSLRSGDGSPAPSAPAEGASGAAYAPAQAPDTAPAPSSAAPVAPEAPAGAGPEAGAPPPQLPPSPSAQLEAGGAGSHEKTSSAPPPASTSGKPPDPPRTPPSPEPPAREFDQSAARAALTKAAAEANACKGPGGPTGSGKARVLFGPDGASLSVVLEGPIGSTPISGCIMSAFRRARVPAFAGAPQRVVRSFTIR
jgi:serine/threonine protein kinase